MTPGSRVQLNAARALAELSVEELWWRYFALGGSAAPEVLSEALSEEGSQPVPDIDVLIHALNERFAERGLDHALPYTDEPEGWRPAPTVDDVLLVRKLRALVHRLQLRGTRLAPDALAAEIADAAVRCGLHEAAVYLVDQEQQILLPLVAGGAAAVDVDGTVAGRVFQTERPLTVGDDRSWTIWLPLLDSTDRLGVLKLRSPFVSEDLVVAASSFAGAVGELIVSKTQYGDGLVLARRRREMALPAELRWPVLPPLTFVTDRVGIACVLEPAYDVAGDAFDYAMNGDVLHFAIFDAMGHELEATQMANLALGAYRHGRRRKLDLPSIYREMDAALTARHGIDRFVTAQLAELDTNRGVLRWLSAGHPYPLLLRGGRLVTELQAEPCLPIGLATDPGTPAEVSLEPGDRLLFFTDGMVEARSPGGERFSEARLAELTTRALADHQTLAETARRLVRSVRLHRDGPLQDDATLLFVSWDPA